MKLSKIQAPLAITMWDFSWLERRYPGGGYENWERALDELVERGYDAVRIDCYPHLLTAGPDKEWIRPSLWPDTDWGAPDTVRIRIAPDLFEFLALCRERKIGVALSSWFLEDSTKRHRYIANAESLGLMWAETIRIIEREGFLDDILFVDLCNEFPIATFCPFYNPAKIAEANHRTSRIYKDYTESAIREVRESYPDLEYTFSYAGQYDPKDLPAQSVEAFDLIEPHLWIVDNSDLPARIFEAIPKGQEMVGLNSTALASVKYSGEFYRGNPKHWLGCLDELIERVAAHAKTIRKPMVTTECWGVVVYKDWPDCDWGWLKEVCAHGTQKAIETGQWHAIGTSNFCGPQFRGMWDDVAWHQKLTSAIKAGSLPDFQSHHKL